MSELIFTVLIFIIFIAILLLIYNNTVIIKKYKIKTDKACGGLKIVLISDFHNNKRLCPAILSKTRQCKPDIIVIAGDLIDRKHTDFNTAKNLLDGLSDIAEVYYVTGNHEAIVGRQKTADTLGCDNVLADERYKIFDNYSILGISDKINGNDEKKSDLLTVFQRLDNFKIVIVHRPTEFTTGLDISKYDIDLVLSGHNHGGLVRIPFYGALYSPDEGFFPRFSKGLYKNNGSQMIISAGAGNTFLPLRLNNFPEIVSISIEN